MSVGLYYSGYIGKKNLKGKCGCRIYVYFTRLKKAKFFSAKVKIGMSCVFENEKPKWAKSKFSHKD